MRTYAYIVIVCVRAGEGMTLRLNERQSKRIALIALIVALFVFASVALVFSAPVSDDSANAAAVQVGNDATSALSVSSPSFSNDILTYSFGAVSSDMVSWSGYCYNGSNTYYVTTGANGKFGVWHGSNTNNDTRFPFFYYNLESFIHLFYLL